MKKITRTLAATIAAITTAASFGTLYNASANEYFMSDEEIQYMNSFSEDIEKDIVKYLFENGCSMDEAESMMTRYMNGKAISESKKMARAVSNPYYYNSTKLAPVDHFIALIVTDPTQGEDTLTVNITGNPANVSSMNYRFLCLSYSDSATLTGSYKVVNANKWRQSSTYNDIQPLTSYTTAAPLSRYYIKAEGSTNTEAQLYNAVSMTYNAMENSDFILAYETYARGDVNHDGTVDDEDLSKLMEYLVDKTALNFIYRDGSNHYSFVTNVLAADTNLDGAVGIADQLTLNKYLEGTPFPAVPSTN